MNKIAEQHDSQTMTREQKIELCRLYNNSDIECFLYAKSFCNNELLKRLEKIIAINMETDIGTCENVRPITPKEDDFYHEEKRKILTELAGIEFHGGDGYFEGKFYD